jgi:uncharacterized damage-inducible protein DinB
MNNKPEVWLRGPLDDMPALLQPVAHALLQAREELDILINDFPDELLWKKPAGLASPGFHLQHLTGVLDRLFTYANGMQLSRKQLEALAAEGKPVDETSQELVAVFSKKVDETLSQLTNTDKATLTDKRGVGRGQLPSTVIGLYTHAAEHTMRHLGQLLVTVKVLKAENT